MKKILTRSGIALVTVAVVVAGAAAFSAYEAHIVNVTATIDNATNISTDAVTFGQVFPQEILHQPVTLALSSSFVASDRTSGVDYMIKQKPKCEIDSQPVGVVALPQYVAVTENSDHNFVCPRGYHKMPLLCPYLSKTSPNKDTDVSVPSFHGPTALESWNDTVSFDTRAIGHLTKKSPSTKWDIDLHVPCFKGECAQDWAKYVTDANPNVTDPSAYMADPVNKGKAMGCDLWVEVTGVSEVPKPETVVVNSNNPQGWFFVNDQSDVVGPYGSFVSGPGTPPLGTGSANLQVADGTEGHAMGKLAYLGTRLDQISKLTYSTYRTSGASPLALSLQFNIDTDLTDANTSWQGRLVYEPYFTETVNTGVWQTWDTMSQGKWWFTKSPQNTVCSQASPCTWSQVLTNFPNIGVHGSLGAVYFKAGSGWTGGFNGNIDNFDIKVGLNEKIYNFEQ